MAATWACICGIGLANSGDMCDVCDGKKHTHEMGALVEIDHYDSALRALTDFALPAQQDNAVDRAHAITEAVRALLSRADRAETDGRALADKTTGLLSALRDAKASL